MKAPLARRTRLKVEDRRKQIVEVATELFAEQGFDANTRTLAKRLGTTQPLLYRYFPSKELLIDAVLDLLFDRYSQSEAIEIIADRQRPIRDRLVDFSIFYSSRTYDRQWIRVYMFAGLAGGNSNRRYIANITEPLLRMIATEIRLSLGVNPARGAGITNEEIEYLWLFHGGLYYQAIRQHIYGLHVDTGMTRDLVNISVDALLAGFEKLLDRSR